jgi:hypothetical protein
MKSIKESIRKHIAIMEDAHKPELSLYKAINKYFKDVLKCFIYINNKKYYFSSKKDTH